MKKGAIHLDWVISIGIFLMYILFFFIFISPFYKAPTQEGVIMLDILMDNFREEVYWNVTKMPIFIINCDSCVGSPGGEDFCLPSFPFEEMSESTMIFTVSLKNPENINFVINENCDSDGRPGGDDITDLTFSYDLGSKKETFWIIYNKGANYLNTMWGTSDCNNYNDDLGICNFLQYIGDGEGDYDYYYGLAEKIFGISLKDFNNLDYDDLKEEWRFPTGADFWIRIKYIDETKGELPPFGSEEPYEQANVYVREWSDYILNEDGTKEAIKINMAVWR